MNALLIVIAAIIFVMVAGCFAFAAVGAWIDRKAETWRE
jgi:hypothetical protein